MDCPDQGISKSSDLKAATTIDDSKLESLERGLHAVEARMGYPFKKDSTSKESKLFVTISQ
jgi:hypothetical protein